MRLERVIVEAPATSANLGPGFDVFALALKEPLDRVEASTEGSGPPRVLVEVVGNEGLPTEPRLNAAGAVALSMQRKLRLKGKLTIRLKKGVPVGVGLGSSGASSAAAAVAVDRLFGLRTKVRELVGFAGLGEKVASGAAHLDNVTAALMGGFVIVPQGTEAPFRFEPPPQLEVVVVTPRVKLPSRKTEYARALLPKKAALGDMVKNVSRASVMVAGFAVKDVAMIGAGMEDAVVEPARAKMVPGLNSVRRAAKEAGAAGLSISGAGPSVVCLLDGRLADADTVLRAVVGAFDDAGLGADGLATKVGKGARVVESS